MFNMLTSERQLARRMDNIAWMHRLTLHLP
jgi:hypothetical protein